MFARKVGQTNAFFFDSTGRQILSLDIRAVHRSNNAVFDRFGIFSNELPGVVAGNRTEAYFDDLSVNGTRLNSEMLAESTRLGPGDRIYIERYVIIFQPDDAPPETLEKEETTRIS